MPATKTPIDEFSLEPPLDIAEPRFRRWAVIFAFTAIALLLVMAIPALRDAIKPLDEWFWQFAVDHEYPLLVTGAEAMALIGGTVAMAGLTIIGAIVLAAQRRWPALAVWLVIIALGSALNATIKAIYERPRPPLGLAQEHSWSFASGHSLTAAMMALLIVLVCVPAGPRRRTWLMVGAVYALLMAASRVYLRVHWFTDVTAGLAIGAATTLVLLLLAGWWLARSAD